MVLSGSRDDGAFGLATIVEHGGAGLVQAPAEALHPSMPVQAAELVPDARVMPVAAMGAALAEMTDGMTGPAPVPLSGDAQVVAEDAMAAMEDLTAESAGGVPAGFGCPSCHGALFELPGGHRPPRFRCRVGHAWSALGLIEEQGEALEGALWMALRSLEEKAALSRRMADSASMRGSVMTAERYNEVSRAADDAGRIIRQLIEQLGSVEDKPLVADEL